MAIVRLAGGILWREGSRLAVIHRPRQADWSLPKGRVDEGETWEEAALREVEEETGCEARITSFAGAASYVQRRTPRLVLYWHMALVREDPFEASKEVDELDWLAPADALARLDHETERRVLQRSRLPEQRAEPRATGAQSAEVAAARAEILRRVLAPSGKGKGNAAGLGPALDLLDRAEEAWAGGAAKEASALTEEARRMGLLALSEPELSLRARALREEARGLARWRRRAIRRLLSHDVSPEAVHLAAALRDQALEERVRPAQLIAASAIAAAAVAALALVLWLAPSSSRGLGFLAGLCGALAGAAIAALLYSRSVAREG